MTIPLPILADAEDWLRLLPLAIPILLWLIVSVAEAVKGTSKKTPRRPRPPAQRRPETQPARPTGRRPVPPPRVQPPAMRVPPPPVPVPRKPAQSRPPKRKAPPPVRRPEELEVILEAVPSRMRASTSPITDQPQKSQPPATATALQLHRWLQPPTLQSQFILTEILQPPVSLRERREWDV